MDDKYLCFASPHRYAESLSRAAGSAVSLLRKFREQRVASAHNAWHTHHDMGGGTEMNDSDSSNKPAFLQHPTLVVSAFDIYLVRPSWFPSLVSGDDTSTPQFTAIEGAGSETEASRQLFSGTFLHFKHWRACASMSSPVIADRTYCAKVR